MDRHCRGPDPSNPVDGKCIGRTCFCPFPWSGPGCSRRLTCEYWEHVRGWGDTLCELDLALTSLASDSFVCSCRGVGTLDLIVVQKQIRVSKPKPLFSIRAINWGDILHYFTWETFLRYPQARWSGVDSLSHALKRVPVCSAARVPVCSASLGYLLLPAISLACRSMRSCSAWIWRGSSRC